LSQSLRILHFTYSMLGIIIILEIVYELVKTRYLLYIFLNLQCNIIDFSCNETVCNHVSLNFDFFSLKLVFFMFLNYFDILI